MKANTEMVKRLTVCSKNKLEEGREMGLKLPEEMRLWQDFLSLPNVLLPILASHTFFIRRSRMVPRILVKAGSRGEGRCTGLGQSICSMH